MMDWWARKIREIEEKSQLLAQINPVMFEPMQIHMLRKYVDDCLVVMEQMKLGVRWDQGKEAFLWSEQMEQEDRNSNLDPEENTMKQFACMASGVTKCLQFTFDSPKSNPSGAMPVLDTAMWGGREQRESGIPPDMLDKEGLVMTRVGELKEIVLYRFYQKPMTNLLVNLASNAAPDQMKISTVSNKIIRRLKTTSRDLHPSVIEGVLLK